MDLGWCSGWLSVDPRLAWCETFGETGRDSRDSLAPTGDADMANAELQGMMILTRLLFFSCSALNWCD